MKFSVAPIVALATLALNAGHVQAGPVAMGLCYSACNAGYVTCCTSEDVRAEYYTQHPCQWFTKSLVATSSGRGLGS
ncbi:hypothetical protein RSAG8_01634, partial [Rhizoctonia solani AG-8 WAC10335]